MPWIHVEDLCSIYLSAIENETMIGPYNAVLRDGTTNYVFSKKLAKVFGYSLWLPNVPEFLIRLVFGEMAQIILKGQRVSSDKITKTGFEFKYTKLGSALRDCLNNN
jgi:NAD dependent epimerase/dehydratase family enzyme